MLFHTHILHHHTTLLNRFADRCLAPHRYLFQGRTIEVWKTTVIESYPSYTEKRWLITAASIALWVHGLILGTLAKVLALAFSSSLRSAYQAAFVFDRHPHALKSGISLEVSHARLEKRAAAIRSQMSSKDMWSKKAFIDEVSGFMEAAYTEIELLYSQLMLRHGPDADAMAKAIIRQHATQADPTVYSFTYFYSSLTEMYHLARSCSIINGDNYEFPPLEDEDQAPYFDPQNVKFRWRQLYNDFCGKLDEHDLNGRLWDGRFANWSVPDTGTVNKYGFPDTRPTPPQGYFDN